MKDFQHMIPEIGYFLIAAAGGFLRYLSNIIGGKVVYTFSGAIVWVVCAGLLGILAGWIVPVITDVVNYQQALIYVAGMLSIEIIKLISTKVLDLISRFVDDVGKK